MPHIFKMVIAQQQQQKKNIYIYSCLVVVDQASEKNHNGKAIAGLFLQCFLLLDGWVFT